MNGSIIPTLLILLFAILAPIGYLLLTAYINTPLLLPHSLLLRRRTNVRIVSKYPSSLRCLNYIFITIISNYGIFNLKILLVTADTSLPQDVLPLGQRRSENLA